MDYNTYKKGSDTAPYTKGINIHGQEVPINLLFKFVLADKEQLVSLEVPDGVNRVECQGNFLTELKLPDSVEILKCDKDLFDYDECKAKWVNIYYE